MAEAERKMHFAYSLTFFILFPPLSKSAEHLFPSSPIWVALSTRRHYYIEFALCVTFHRSAWNLAGTKKNVFHFLHEKSEHGAHFSWKSSSVQIEMKPSIFLAPKAHFRQEKKSIWNQCLTLRKSISQPVNSIIDSCISLVGIHYVLQITFRNFKLLSIF